MMDKNDVIVIIKEYAKDLVYRENCKLRHKEIIDVKEDIKTLINSRENDKNKLIYIMVLIIINLCGLLYVGIATAR